MDQGPGPVLPEHLESVQLNLGAPPSSVHTSASTQGVSDIRFMGEPQRAERREEGSHTSERSANGWFSVWSVHASDQSNPTLDLPVKPSLAPQAMLARTEWQPLTAAIVPLGGCHNNNVGEASHLASEFWFSDRPTASRMDTVKH